MELLLNLSWLLLAVPACWLWNSARARQRRDSGSLQCLLALVCVLVLLFPVISATDDLHAMQTEMEESGTSKRSARQAGGDKLSVWTPIVPSLPSNTVSIARGIDCRERLLTPSFSVLKQPYAVRAGRAPPLSYLA